MNVRATSAAILLILAAVLTSGSAWAQKSGGTLRVYISSNPLSASIHEAGIMTVMPFMGVFNNLVLFDQSKPRNSIDTIIPDLAESWTWDASNTKLTFRLRKGVTWHDGKPFTAREGCIPLTKLGWRPANLLRA